MATPLFIHDGAEPYGGLKATLMRMIQEDHLSDSVIIAMDEEQLILSGPWHLIADKACHPDRRCRRCIFSAPMLLVFVGAQ
jgi:hypothetical protein